MANSAISATERTTLLLSVLIISICAIIYELLIATLTSYLLGNSVTQFSFTMGLFLFAMGIGSLLSGQIRSAEVRWFILIELIIGVAGGFSAVALFAVFSLQEEYYYLAMGSIIFTIGICSGMEIPLLTRIVARQEDLSQALANVLSVDYLGALLASLAFPLLLLPQLGIILTALLMGLFNLAVAGVNLWLFHARLKPRWRQLFWAGGSVAFLLLIGGMVYSKSLTHWLEQQLYQDVIIYRQQTPYQQIIITRNATDIRLFLDGQLQFSSRDEYRYHELLVHPVMSAARNHERVAILGGGDGLVVRELLKYDEIEEIVLVDLDPEVTKLAQNYPLIRDLNQNALADERVRVVNSDAYNFIEHGEDLFSVIIIDLPDPNNESLSKLYSETFYQLLKKRLTPDGAFVTQATSPYFAREAFWCITATIQAAGFQVLPLHTYIPSFGEWGFVIGTPTRPAQVKLPPNLALRYLSDEVLTSAQFFDPDIDRVNVEISTLDRPLVLDYYEQGWRHWD